MPERLKTPSRLKICLSYSSGLLLLFALFAWGFSPKQKWYKAGTAKNSYYMGLDSSTEKNGAMASTIRSLEKRVDGFATIATSVDAKAFLGKEIRLTGYIKTKEVKGFAGFWMRIDGEKNELLFIENMQNRNIKGNTPWKQYSIQTDVPAEAVTISYGALIDDGGQLWFADLNVINLNP